jgi:hypothetical protein
MCENINVLPQEYCFVHFSRPGKFITLQNNIFLFSKTLSQLILPESFKLYPLYTVALLKQKALRGGPEMSTDTRVLNMRLLKNLSLPESISLLYPRLFGLHNLDDMVGILNSRTMY